MRGVPLKAVQELLGHATIDMTMRYSHLSPDLRRDAVKALERDPAGANGGMKKQNPLISQRVSDAQGGIRTRTPFGATPSRWCVYLIPPYPHYSLPNVKYM